MTVKSEDFFKKELLENLAAPTQEELFFITCSDFSVITVISGVNLARPENLEKMLARAVAPSQGRKGELPGS